MRAVLVILGAVVLLAACTKEVKLVTATSSREPLVVSEKATVELRLSAAYLAKDPDPDGFVWQNSREAGLLKVFNKILNKDLLVTPVDGLFPPDIDEGRFTSTGLLSQSRDEETGDFVQNFLVSTRFVGDLDLGGQIIVNEEANYIAGMHDIVYAMLYKTVPPALPAYVVIAEPAEELGSSFARVIGMAEVKQLMTDTVSLPQEQGGASGTLCVLEIMVSDREIEAGDRVFLLTVDVAALDSPPALPGHRELETVVVQPPYSDKVQEPREKK